MTKNRQKLNCAKFFEKFKNCFFFWFFLSRCLKISSEGTKNNQKKISSSFREICEFVFKKSKKKPTPNFGEIFWKKEHSDFFPRIFQNKMQKHIFKGTEKIKKNYEVVFKIWAKKKKWTDHPIHPSIHPSIPSIHPSVNKNWRGRLVPRCGILGESTEKGWNTVWMWRDGSIQIYVISYYLTLIV